MVSGARKTVQRNASPVRPAPTQNSGNQPSRLEMYPPEMPPTMDPLAREAE